MNAGQNEVFCITGSLSCMTSSRCCSIGFRSFIQRFDVHVHVLFLDGVYVREGDPESAPLVFLELPAPTGEEVGEVAHRSAERIKKVEPGNQPSKVTRIPVATVVRSRQFGIDFDEILVQYPTLRPEHVHAALLHYFDNRAEVDSLIAESEEPPPGAIVQ